MADLSQPCVSDSAPGQQEEGQEDRLVSFQQRIIVNNRATQKTKAKSSRRQQQHPNHWESVECPEDRLGHDQQGDPNQAITVSIENLDVRKVNEPGPAQINHNDRPGPSGQEPGSQERHYGL